MASINTVLSTGLTVGGGDVKKSICRPQPTKHDVYKKGVGWVGFQLHGCSYHLFFLTAFTAGPHLATGVTVMKTL